jgi:hypothetical protein
MLDAIGRVTVGAVEAALKDPPGSTEFGFLEAGDQNKRLPCIILFESDHIVLKDLGLESCWLSAVFMQNSRNVPVAESFIVGSPYALVVWNDTGQPDRATGYQITDNVWVQDVSGYGPDKTPACRDSNADADCPGDMWRVWPWGATHDAEWEPYNGALFGGIDVGGDVLFARNRCAMPTTASASNRHAPAGRLARSASSKHTVTSP